MKCFKQGERTCASIIKQSTISIQQNIKIEVYPKLNQGVMICVDIALLDLTFSCVLIKQGEKDGVS